MDIETLVVQVELVNARVSAKSAEYRRVAVAVLAAQFDQDEVRLTWYEMVDAVRWSSFASDATAAITVALNYGLELEADEVY